MFVALPVNTAAAEPKPLTGAQQIAEARRDLDALNIKVALAVEDYDLGQIALAKATKQSEVAAARVARSRKHLAAVQREFGSVASAAYRGGTSGDFVSLVTTSSPQTFLDKASALDHLARSKQLQIQQLRAANRELRAAKAASEQALKLQRTVAARLARARVSISSDVAKQEVLLKKLETDEERRIAAEKRRIAAERAAERRRQEALAAARAEKARLARIEKARLARVEAARKARAAEAAAARVQALARARQARRLAQQRAARAVAAEQAERAAERAAEEAAAREAAQARAASEAAEAASNAAESEAQQAPEPEPEREPEPGPEPEPKPEPEPENDGPANDEGGGSRAAIAVREAHRQLGKRYVWAADGPDTFDCSGLTQWVWAKAGVSLPHSSRAQFGHGTRVSRSELRPGDLVFFGSPIHHVGIYIGGGSFIAAPQTGEVVSVKSMGRRDYVGAVRL